MAIRQKLKADRDSLWIGEVANPDTLANFTRNITPGSIKFHHAFSSLTVARLHRLSVSGIRESQPAVHEVCANTIRQDARARLPRGLERKISRLMQAKRNTASEHFEKEIVHE